MQRGLKISLIVLGSLGGVVLLVSIFSMVIYGLKQSNGNTSVSTMPMYDYATDDHMLGSMEDASKSYINTDYLYDSDGSYDITDEQKLKKTGNINTLVSNIDDMLISVKEVLGDYNGVILSSYDSGADNDRYVRVRMKVESKDFDSVMDRLLALEGDVQSSQVDTQDITQDYIDIQSRLKNLKSTEAQLVKILNSAESVSDTLAVYNQLTSIRSQIEVYEGQLKYMDNQTDYSYITMTFSLNKEGLEISDREWKPVGEFKVALNAFVSVLRGLGNVIIWLIVFSPFILIPLGIVLVVRKQKIKK